MRNLLGQLTLITCGLWLMAGISPAEASFTACVVDTTCDGNAGVFAGDIDSDGDIDIIAASLQDDEVAWWSNDGGSPLGWTKHVIDSEYEGALYVHAADVDGDHLLDVLATGRLIVNGTPVDGKVTWWRNDGSNPIHWEKHVVTDGFINAHGIYACDLNNDSHTDILATSQMQNRVSWWENSGADSISWTEHTIDSTYIGTQSVCAADLDDDGRLDVLGAAGGSNLVSWWHNDGGTPLTWTRQDVGLGCDLAHWVSSADINGDGHLDILGAMFLDHEIAWWRSNGQYPTSWTKQTIGSNFLGASTVYAADLDNDGDEDVVGTAWISDDVAWWENRGGYPIAWIRHTLDYEFLGAWPLFVSDLDGDSDVDIITGSDILDYPGTPAFLTWWDNGTITPVTGIADDASPLPSDLRPARNHPNPFNPATTIEFALPRPTAVSMVICDASGRLVKRLANDEVMAGGEHRVRWDGTDEDHGPVTSGIYFCRIQTEERTDVLRVVLLK